MRITTTKTKTGRINILADGEYQFTVPVLLWYAAGFAEGEDLSPEALAAFCAEAEEADAYEKAVSLLSVRAHGERELFRKLRRSFSPEAAAAAVAKCRENLLLDDARFAGALAEELFRKKHFAPERIELELKARGIDREIAKNAVCALDIDKKSGIMKIIEKSHLPEEVTQKELDRLLRRLLNAGYTMAEIRQVLRISEEYTE